MFSRYGYLSTSMRVIPRNDSDTWIFREPTFDVFSNPLPALTRSTKSAPAPAVVFDGDIHTEFCDVRQLLQAYFRDFEFKRLERPWRAFTGCWSCAAIGRHLGISSSFAGGEHCSMLVRVARFRETKRLAITAESLALDEAVAREADNITIGDTASVVRFVKNFESHYIASYITGNSLYQVFVYTPQVNLRIKERLKSRGVADLSSLELSNYFSPWYAEHMGGDPVGLRQPLGRVLGDRATARPVLHLHVRLAAQVARGRGPPAPAGRAPRQRSPAPASPTHPRAPVHRL